MNRSVTLVAVALGVGITGCGKGPEDKAQDAGQTIGEAIAKIQTASSAEDAGKQVDTIKAQLAKIKDELPSAYDDALASIGDDLQSDVDSANGDPAQLREAFSTAADSFRSLNSNTNSVVNELRRGVREGYDDELDG